MATLCETPSISFAPGDFASRPAEVRGLARDAVRLLIGTAGGIEHARFSDLPEHLRAGDVLVVNTSATQPGEVDATIHGEPVVLHLAARLDDETRAIELRTPPDAARPVLDAAPGTEVVVGDVRLRLVSSWPDDHPSSPTGSGNRLWRAAIDGDLQGELQRRGRPIAYGYLDRRYPLSAYQTVFGVDPGSAEMASAGRPFTPELVARLVAAGIVFAPVTLHTGVSSQEAGEAPTPEWFEVPAASARSIDAARTAGGHVIAVGTTATRAVESASEGGRTTPASGWTSRVVTPADPPRVVDGLVTGWHDPQASHLLLVEAVAGRELAQAAYAAAAREGYLWHEFGDSALLLPG